MMNASKPAIPGNENGRLFKVSDGTQLFIYDYQPQAEYSSTIFVISGITGINHNTEKEIIEQFSNKKQRVVVIHPRGTGYSDGRRGDLPDFSDFINDFIEIIKNDKDYLSTRHSIILYGHSMSTAIVLAVADRLEKPDGAILVNPPYLQKYVKGMSPGALQYIKYAFYIIFARHTPIVNMAGDPSLIENEEERRESEQRINDPLLVKYLSMYMMIQSKRIIDSMVLYSEKADYPLLLLYGENDNIVDPKGCKILFDAWNYNDKEYVIVENGSHGRSTVIQAKEIINRWITERKIEE